MIERNRQNVKDREKYRERYINRRNRTGISNKDWLGGHIRLERERKRERKKERDKYCSEDRDKDTNERERERKTDRGVQEQYS